MQTPNTAIIVILALSVFPACIFELGDEIDSAPDSSDPVTLRSDTDWESQHTEMVSILALNPTDAQRLRTVFQARETELGGWIRGDRGAKLVELETALRAAATNSELTETRKFIAQATPLRREFEALAEGHETNILNALTPAQQNQWQGHQLAQKLLDLMAPLNLDPTQQEQIRAAATQAIAQAKQQQQPNPPAAAFLELEKWAEDNILNGNQRQAYAPIKQKNALRSL
jgi:hypothetical protein